MNVCLVDVPQEVSIKASEQSEDLKLTRRCQAGDTEAFDGLVTKYRSKIFTMICCIVGNENDAWDLAQGRILESLAIDPPL
jgi:RNA polymerase sigma-70 factor, ECF subfamily